LQTRASLLTAPHVPCAKSPTKGQTGLKLSHFPPIFSAFTVAP
jgi:hypothetical protein